jgi:hypothetical protein
MSLCDTVVAALSALKGMAMAAIDYVHHFGSSSTNYGSLVAALIAAAILFIIRESFNRAATFSGTFYVKTTVEETARNPYRGMDVYYTVVVYSDGHVVSGTSEKTGEKCIEHSMEYVGTKRKRGVVNGMIERNYLRSSVMNIHIVEQGRDREYTTYMSIKISRYRLVWGLFTGTFYSTAANSKGSVLCGRIEFKEHPTGYVQYQSTSESSS